MKLTGLQLKQLREAVLSAFPGEEELEEMLLEEMDERLNNIDKGKRYSTTVRKLIEWAEKEGRIRDLVIAASRVVPGNLKLRTTVTTLFNILLEAPDFLSSEIIAVLRQAHDCSKISECCRLTLPDAEVHRSSLMESIEDDRLSPDARWLIVLHLLLHDYPKQQGTPSILIFVDHLLQQEPATASRDLLKQRLDEVAVRYNYQPLKPASESDLAVSNESSLVLQGYLLIIVQPLSNDNSKSAWQVHGFLIVKTSDQDDFTQSRLFPISGLSNSQIEQTDQISQTSQKGTTCTFEELQKQVPVWIGLAKKKLSEQARELSCTYDLTVEFFLPYEQLAAEVDLWEVKTAIARRECWEALGKSHRVVVRSSDRLSDPDLLNHLRKVWQRVGQFLQTQPTPEAIRAKCEHIRQLSCRWDSLIPRWRQCLALKLTAGLPDQMREKEDLFIALLTSGIPIALWTRQPELADIDIPTEFNNFLSLECFCDLDRLLEQIRQQREHAHVQETPCNYLGYHLGILCDEPRRLERLNQFGIENNLWGMSA